METTIYQILESIKAESRTKKFKKKKASSIDEGMEALGVALRFKMKSAALCKESV